MPQPTVFVSYSHQDSKEKDILLTHLGALQRRGLIRVWSDDEIGVGVEWEESINQAIAQAKVAILLITANFLSSEFITEKEVPALMARHRAEGLIIFPVIAKDCAWRKIDWLAKMNVRPRDGRPVWSDEGKHIDKDLAAIAEEVVNIIDREKPRPPVDIISRQSQSPAFNFEIKISCYALASYKAEITSPTGQTTTTFRLPFDRQILETTLSEYRAHLKNTRHQPVEQPFSPATAQILKPEQLGAQLFTSIFRDEVLRLYKEGQRQVGRTRSLPIIFNIDCNAPTLINLPWEFLYDTSDQGARGQFLAFHQNTPILRCWLKSRPVDLTYDPPLRVLLVSANPDGTVPLNVQREYRLIRDRLSSLNRGSEIKVRIDYQPAVALSELKQIIRDPDRTPHLIHFMGHGGLGALLMEDKEGGGKAISEQSLAVILGNAPSLRLVVLNACETAKTDLLEKSLGVAQSLAEAGVPAVVAMQFAISDEAALVFAEEFYQLIAEGQSIDAAVTWGRIAILNELEGSATKEWATPVLYLQSPDGHIFTDLLGQLPKPQMDSRRETAGTDQADETLPSIKPAAHPSKTEQMRREAEEKAAEIEHWQRLRKEKSRRLWLLEEQKASKGYDTPPQIILEIADLRQELEGIKQQLAVLEPEIPLHDTTPLPVATRRLEISGVTDSQAFEQGKVADSGVHSEAFKLYTQGRAALQKEEWGQALGYLSRAQKLAPGLPEIDRFISQARQTWRQTLEGDQEYDTLEALYIQAQQYLAQTEIDWEKAARLLERIIRSDAGFKDAYELALQSRSQAEKEKAERERQAKLELLYSQTQTYLGEENWVKATESLTEITDIDQNYLDAQSLLYEATRQRDLQEAYQQGEAYFKKEDWAKAVAAFGKVASIDPAYREGQAAKLLRLSRQQRQLDIWLQEAEDYLNQQDWEAAIEVLEEHQVVKERPEARIPLHYAYAQRYLSQPNWAEAVNYLKEVIEARPNYRPDLNTLYQQANEELHLQQQFEKAVAQIKQQEWAAAKATLEAIVQTRAHYPLAQERLDEVNEAIRLADLYKKAQGALELKQWAKSIPYLQQIPNYQDAGRLLAEAHKQVKLEAFYKDGLEAAGNGHWDEAVAAFERVIDLDLAYREAPQQLQLARNKIALQQSYNQGMAALESGRQRDLTRLDEAIHWLETVVQIDGRYRGAENKLHEAKRERLLLWHYQQGQVANEQEQWATAIEHWQAIVKDQNEPDYHGDSARRLVEAERQQRLSELYLQADRKFKAAEWDNAIILLEKLQQETAGETYKDLEDLLAEAKIQQELLQHYRLAEQMLAAEQWAKALEYLEQIRARRANYRAVEVEPMLVEARANSEAARHYQAGQEALQAEKWAEAVTAFERAYNLRADFRDVETRLNQARQQQTLYRHYQTARQAMENEAWGHAIDHLVAIQSLDPAFKDARQQLEEAEKQQQLAVDYQAALNHFEAERWAEARAGFDDILARQKEYKEANSYRAQAQLQLEMADRFERAAHKRELARQQPELWQSVVELLTVVVDWQADYQGGQASAWLVEARQQAELDLLYKRAEVLGNKNEIPAFEEAIRLLAQIIQIDLNYQNAAPFKAQCEQKLAQKKEEQRQAEIKAEIKLKFREAIKSAQQANFTETLARLDEIIELDISYKHSCESLQAEITRLIQACQAKYQQGKKLKEHGQAKQALAILKEYEQEKVTLSGRIQTLLEQNLPK